LGNLTGRRTKEIFITDTAILSQRRTVQQHPRDVLEPIAYWNLILFIIDMFSTD
jgi:hypothetical protein